MAQSRRSLSPSSSIDTRERTRSWSPTRIFSRKPSATSISTSTSVSTSEEYAPPVVRNKTLEWSFFSAFASGDRIARVCQDQGSISHRDLVNVYMQGHEFRAIQQDLSNLYGRHQDAVTNIDFDFTPAPPSIRVSRGDLQARNYDDCKAWWFSNWLNNYHVSDMLLDNQVSRFCWAITSTAKLVPENRKRVVTFRVTGQYGITSRFAINRLLKACSDRGVTVEFAGDWVLPRSKNTSEVDDDDKSTNNRGLRKTVRRRINQYKFIKQFM